MLLYRLLLIDQRFSPQIQLARLALLPVANQKCSPQIQLAILSADKNWFTSLTSTTVPSDEPGSDGEYFSDHAAPSHVDEEGEVSDLEFADRE